MKLRMARSRVGALRGSAPVVRTDIAVDQALQPQAQHEPRPLVVLPDSCTPFAAIRRGSGIMLTGVRGVDGVAMVCKDFPPGSRGRIEYNTTRMLTDDDMSTGDNLFVRLMGSCESIYRDGFAFSTQRALGSMAQYWRSPHDFDAPLGGASVRGSEVLRSATAATTRMHELGFAHNDIKPDNLLLYMLDGVPVVVLCDFGLTRRSDRVDHAHGTDGYRYL